MSAVLAVAPTEAEEKEWTPNREVTLERLRIVAMMHEGWPQCRLCGQTVYRLDTFGLCSKTTESHRHRRGDFTPVKKARKR
ncbi:hypothetical protein [Microbacterium sp. MYb62]|uniref:hypothetical protein n=1 Tax=Microbacterium sp. MYb62 TaxID=1848690 RepID=UPI000CFC1727|nr:hypothetical protein [Microbacterium sp. MYb62]PRB14485.1 hypothetical protein CQ042_11245 [Microbacterium sp. MYb62]